jgi:transposase
MVEQPDEVQRQRPEVCSACQESLREVPGSLVDRRQVFDLPEVRLRAREYQLEAVCCPICHTIT